MAKKTQDGSDDYRVGVRIAASGQEAVHIHACTEGPHEWVCNSSYCGARIRLCPAHGGNLPKHDEGES